MHPRDRDRIVLVIRELENAVLDAHAAGTWLDTVELTCAVLARLGVDPSTYERALREDAELATLEHAALTEAVAGNPDPGPYGCISREAPTGRPGDEGVTARRNLIPELGRTVKALRRFGR